MDSLNNTNDMNRDDSQPQHQPLNPFGQLEQEASCFSERETTLPIYTPDQNPGCTPDQPFAGVRPPNFSVLMKSMSFLDYPQPLMTLLHRVQDCFLKSIVFNGTPTSYGEVLRAAPDALFATLEKVQSDMAFLPSKKLVPRDEAVAVNFGEAMLRDTLRSAVDYALVFSSGMCRRIWILSDCWSLHPVEHSRHYLRVLREKGVLLRFLLVSPWGWVELPVASLIKLSHDNVSDTADTANSHANGKNSQGDKGDSGSTK